MESGEKKHADRLRAFARDNYGIELGSSHAHEIVSAAFGYNSKAALRADRVAPISNLEQAEYVLPVHHPLVEERCKRLGVLSIELPEGCASADIVYMSLFSGDFGLSQGRRFDSPLEMAKAIVDNDAGFQHAFKFYDKVPLHHFTSVERSENHLVLRVVHSCKTDGWKASAAGDTTIRLPRVAGHIGYGRPQVSVVRRTGRARDMLAY